MNPHFLNNASQKELNDFLSNPQNLNPYSYTRNNPVNYMDPKGEQAVPIDVVLDPMTISESYQNMQSKQTTWSQIKFGADLALVIIPFAPTITTLEKTVESTKGLVKSTGKLLNSLGKSLGKVGSKLANLGNKIFGASKDSKFLQTRIGKIELTDHALERMSFWKVDDEQVMEVINYGENFEYFHQGVLKKGFL